jgi:magnesium chelatase subunit I
MPESMLLEILKQRMLYIDEVNLLDNMAMDSILDAAAQGWVTVRRGPLIAVCPSNLVLVGSMNPEEGTLRPQLHDRFGLRFVVDGNVIKMDCVLTRREAFS